jgi:hypothetical protein
MWTEGEKSPELVRLLQKLDELHNQIAECLEVDDVKQARELRRTLFATTLAIDRIAQSAKVLDRAG